EVSNRLDEKDRALEQQRGEVAQLREERDRLAAEAAAAATATQTLSAQMSFRLEEKDLALEELRGEVAQLRQERDHLAAEAAAAPPAADIAAAVAEQVEVRLLDIAHYEAELTEFR